MDLLNETVLLKTKSTLFKLLIRETSQFLCYERLLNMTYVAYKNAFFREMQFWSHCYTVVSYQALFRLSVYKIPAVYLSGAKNLCFCTICNFGSPTKMSSILTKKIQQSNHLNHQLDNLGIVDLVKGKYHHSYCHLNYYKIPLRRFKHF